MNSYIENRLRRRRAKRRLFRLMLFALVIIAASAVISNFANTILSTKSTLVWPIKTVNSLPNPSNPAQEQNSPLGSVIQKALEGTKGTYGVVVKNLKSGEVYLLNEHKKYESGSLYKLWVMATVYQQIQAGILTEDQILSEAIVTLNDEFNIDGEWAELTEGVITLSVADALKQMITISHNYAALLLTKKVKLSTVASFLKEHGFAESAVGTDSNLPTSTPYDITLFLEKLYKGELANEQFSRAMTDLLKKQKLNDKLPKYLPKGTEIAHKTGEIDQATHDAGIVYAPSGDYIIVVLSDSTSPPGAEERIAEISKAVYDYFTNLK